MTLQVVSLIRPSKSKQHGTKNNRSWLSTCSQVIKPWLLKIHGKPCHTFAKLDAPEQELDVKKTWKRRAKDRQKKKEMDTSCRICHQRGESVYHLASSCPVLAPARMLYQEILKSDELTMKHHLSQRRGKRKSGGMNLPKPLEKWRKTDLILSSGIQTRNCVKLWKLQWL